MSDKIFLLILLIKNFISTGCLSYPIYWTCFDNKKITWANPIENTKERFEFISAIAKRWKFYTLEEGNLNNELDYYKKIEENKILSPTEYNKNKFLWLKYWSKDHDIERLLNSFAILLFSFLIFYFSCYTKKNIIKNIVSSFSENKIILAGFIISFLMWFFISPQMRYGGYAIVGGTMSFYVSQILSKFELNIKFFKLAILFLMIISISYFTYKNFSRILISYNQNNFENFPWPKFKDKNLDEHFEEKTINDIKLNLVITKKNIKNNPVHCGNIDMICFPKDRLICISKIYKKNNYIFIENNNTKCLEQFKKNYWMH